MAWDELVASGVAGLEAKLTPYIRQVTGWLLAQAGVVGALTLQFLLTVVIAGDDVRAAANRPPRGPALRPQARRRSAGKTRWCWPARRSAAWRWAWA